jgi:hypothetical protein
MVLTGGGGKAPIVKEELFLCCKDVDDDWQLDNCFPLAKDEYQLIQE